MRSVALALAGVLGLVALAGGCGSGEPEGVLPTREVFPGLEVFEAGLSTYEGPDGGLLATATALVGNSTDGVGPFDVTFTFRGGDGEVVGTAAVPVAGLDVGTPYLSVSGAPVEARAATVELSATPPDPAAPPPGGGRLGVVVVELHQRDGGTLEIEGSVVNPQDEEATAPVLSCALRTGGELVGGLRVELPALPPGGGGPWYHPVPPLDPAVDGAVCLGSSHRAA